MVNVIDGEQGKKRPDGGSLAGRIWLSFLAVLATLIAGEPNSIPERTGRPTFADLLDKVGDTIGRRFCWLEAKLGLRPKNWPPGPS